ncbi:MAG: hypothetical protein CM15mV57_700 [uncultured marine virus]|nr:MAG: hypothetical protein CM15mV57_700 [uncultured marine virus]
MRDRLFPELMLVIVSDSAIDQHIGITTISPRTNANQVNISWVGVQEVFANNILKWWKLGVGDSYEKRQCSGPSLVEQFPLMRCTYQPTTIQLLEPMAIQVAALNVAKVKSEAAPLMFLPLRPMVTFPPVMFRIA